MSVLKDRITTLMNTYQHNFRHCCCRRMWSCIRSGCTTVCRSSECMSDSSLDRLQHITSHFTAYAWRNYWKAERKLASFAIHLRFSESVQELLSFLTPFSCISISISVSHPIIRYASGW